MKITKFNNVYQISKFPKIFPINCFVVEKGDHLVVIDMGLKDFADEVAAVSKESDKPVTHLLLTHAHFDHTNGVNHFKEKFPDAEVGISERDQQLLEGNLSIREGESDEKIKGGFPKDNVKIDFNFSDTAANLTVINTPGHTPGSVSFLDDESGAIFVGDSLQTKGGLAVAGTLNLTFPFPKFATWSQETAVQSAKLLLDSEPTVLCVGHGEMLINPVEKMKEAIQRAEENL